MTEARRKDFNLKGKPDDNRERFILSSGGIALFSVLTALSGLLIDILLASDFGLSGYTDAFYAAYTVPFFIATMAFSLAYSALVPIFSRHTEEKAGAEASAFLSTYLNIAALAGIALATTGVLMGRGIAGLVAPGMSAETAELTGRLAELLSGLVLFSLMAEVLRAFLYAKGAFIYAASSNMMRNVVVVASLLIFSKRDGIMSAAYGYTAGYAVQFLALAGWVFLKGGVRYRPVIDRGVYGLRESLKIGVYQGTGFGILQCVTLAERIIGSYLPAGSITALSYASRIVFMAVETLSGSIATATLPALSRAVGDMDYKRVQDVMGRSFRFSLLLFLPLTALLIALRGPIITVLYQRGAFTPEAVAVMSWVLMLYSLSFVFQGYNRLIHNFLFASLNPKGTLKLFTVLAAVTILLDLALVRPLGISAMPLGYLAGSGVAFFIGRRLFVQEFQVVSGGNYTSFLVRTALLSLLFGGCCYIIFLSFKGVAGADSRMGLLLALFVSIVPAMGLSVAFGSILKITELNALRLYISSRIKGFVG